MEPHEKQRLDNKKQELVEIEQQLPIQTKKLTSVLEAQRLSKEEMDTYKGKILELLAKEQTTLDNEKINWTERKIEAKKEVVQLISTKETLQKDIKEKTKELVHLNQSILNAKDEKEHLDKELPILNEKCAELLRIVANYEEMKVKLHDIEIEHRKVQNDVKELTATSDSELRRKKDELNKAALELADYIIRKDKVQSELKSYTDTLYTSMNDYNIIKSRLEGVWKKKFPELELPME